MKTEFENDLGIHIHESLTPNFHVAEVVKKANQVLGQLLRAVSNWDKWVFVRLYKQQERMPFNVGTHG